MNAAKIKEFIGLLHENCNLRGEGWTSGREDTHLVSEVGGVYWG